VDGSFLARQRVTRPEKEGAKSKLRCLHFATWSGAAGTSESATRGRARQRATVLACCHSENLARSRALGRCPSHPGPRVFAPVAYMHAETPVSR